MAVGVPENDVFAAADAVLARGERPTVDRLRQELGRGSPARVGALLDQWWARLADRLSGETRLPALPAQVAQAFVAVWQQAINLAQAAAEAGMAEQRQILDAERERVAAVENQAQMDSAKFRQQANEAVGDRKLVETRLADLDLLLEQRREQIEDLQQQRDGLVVERDEALRQIQQLQQDLLAVHQKSEEDRSSQETYVRGVEDRAHREVDRAREETKEVIRKNKELGQQIEVLQGRLDSKAEQLSQAQQQAAAQKSRADTLDAQLQTQKKPSQTKSPRVKKSN